MAVFAHGQLRLYLLSLLEAGPRHGYELITALSQRFGGTYRPSAGTVYPRLSRLEEEGLVERSEVGRKSLYALTERGRHELEEHRGELAALEHEIAATVRELAALVRDEVAGSMAGMRADVAAAAQQARAAAARLPRADGHGGLSGAHELSGAHGLSDARTPSGTGWPEGDARRASEDRRVTRLRRTDAEAELTRFRAEMRAALREAEAHGGLPQLTVDTVRTVLASARSAITATLPR